MSNSSPIPVEINLNRPARELDIIFDDGAHFKYPCEYLRVFSPAAEVKAAREKGAATVVKLDINIERISPVGSYAVQLVFNDGHDTGIYSWKTLYVLGESQQKNWASYLKIKKAKQQGEAAKRVELLYFATLAQIIDQEHESLVLDGDINKVRELLSFLSARGELWAQQLDPDKIKVTINKQFVELDQEIFDGDEIALIP